MFRIRQFAVVVGTAAVLLTLVAPAVAAKPATLVVETIRMPARATANRDGRVGISPPPCQDNAFRTLGAHQTSTYKWAYKQSSTPSYLNKSGVISILQKAFNNVVGENNDCGRGDTVSATHQYLGTTSRGPNCNTPDGHNVVGFGKLASGVLAVTCYWINGHKIVEADMKITTRETWALSLSSCRGDMPMLEATVTHEAGHVFGLDHVGERRHGRLTMSPFLDGPCDNNEATLGLGDMLGLESMY